MKNFALCFLFLLFSVFGFSQESVLKSDKKYFEAVDKWVAIQTSDSTYVSGFVYIDQMAGFTFDMHVPFTIDKNGKFISEEKLVTGSVKHRLDNSFKNVSIIPTEKVKELGLDVVPDWLSVYKSNENTVEYMTKVGYFYNSVGGSIHAIPILEKAYSIEPHYQGLEFELSFAYNATKQFDKAIPVLEKAIKKDNKNHLLYKELGYAFIHSEKFDEAEKIYIKGISVDEKKEMSDEMAINMASAYLHLNNEKKFFEWIEIAKTHTSEDSRIKPYIDLYISEWNKRNPK